MTTTKRQPKDQRAELRSRETPSPALANRLQRVAAKITRDCLRFYEDDLDIIDWLVEAAN